jgi:hypothetical protein
MKSTPIRDRMYIGRARLVWKSPVSLLLIRFERKELLGMGGGLGDGDASYKYDPVFDSECVEKIRKGSDIDMQLLGEMGGTLMEISVVNK